LRRRGGTCWARRGCIRRCGTGTRRNGRRCLAPTRCTGCGLVCLRPSERRIEPPSAQGTEKHQPEAALFTAAGAHCTPIAKHERRAGWRLYLTQSRRIARCGNSSRTSSACHSHLLVHGGA
jgi:hypothetical protein